MANASFEKLELQFSEKRLDFQLSKTESAHPDMASHWHTPMTLIALQCVGAGRAHALGES